MGIMLKKPDHVAGSAAPAIIIGLFVAFGGILFGCVHAALPCPALPRSSPGHRRRD